MRRTVRVVAAGCVAAAVTLLPLAATAHAAGDEPGTDGTRVTGGSETDGTRVTGGYLTLGTRVT